LADLYAIAAGLAERSAAAFVSGVPEDAADDGLLGPASVAWQVSADLAPPVAGRSGRARCTAMPRHSPRPWRLAPGRRTEIQQSLLDALFLSEPGVLEARQRITLRMRAARSA
jgi:hypothetical protein